MAEQQGNIKQFNAGDGPALDLGKASEAASQISNSAWREGQFYRQAGEDYRNAGNTLGKAIDQHQFMSEVSSGAPAGAALYNNKLQEWRDMASQPGAANDPELQKKFMDNNLEPALQQYQNAFSTERGQQWALSQVDSMRKEFYHTTSADVMNITGEQRMQDAQTFANQNAAIVSKDPAQADAAMGRIKSYVDGLKGGLTPEESTKLDKFESDQKDEVAKIQVMSLADKGNFSAARAALQAQGEAGHIAPQWQEQLTGYIAAQKVAREVEAQQAREQQQYKDQKQNEQTTHGIFSDMAAGDIIPATNAFSANGLSPEQRKDFLATDKNNPGILQLPRTWLTSTEYGPGFSKTAEAIQNGESVTPGGLTRGVRMYSSQDGITPAGAARLQEMQDKLKTPDGAYEVQMQNTVLTDLQKQLTFGGKYVTDQKGKDIYSGMQSSFYSLWDSEIKAGKTPAQLADPESKDYIGNAFMTLKRSDAQAMSDVVNTKPDTDYLTQLDNAQKQKATPLPPVDKRVVGQTYPTARGPMIWQEGGWAQPKAKE
jgi:hypothetical protein